MPPHLTRLRRQKSRLYSSRHSVGSKYSEVNLKYGRALRNHFAGIESRLIGSGNVKSFYNHVNRKTGGGVEEARIRSGGKPVSDPQIKATLFSHFFSSVFTTDDGSSPILTPKTDHEFVAVHCSPSLLCDVMRTVEGKLSRGPDGIPSFFLKRVISPMSYPLSLLFNWSFTTCTVPLLFKTSIVRPVFKKKGSKFDVNNYRPITLCCCIAKLQEKLVTRLLLEHCSSLGLTSECQYSYLPQSYKKINSKYSYFYKKILGL